MEVSVGYKVCKRDSLGTEIIPLAQSSDHSNTTDFTPRQLWSHIRTPEFTWQGWKVGQFLQNLMLRIKPSSVSETGRLGCSTGDRSLFIYAEKLKVFKKKYYCVPPQGHKSCWNNFGRDSQVIRQKLPLFHNTSPKLLGMKRNADVGAEKNHCCKGLACAWASSLHGQVWQWLCLASSATRRTSQYPLPPSPAPGMAQTFQQLHDLHPPNFKTTGRTKPVKTASACGNPGSGVPHVVPKKAQFPFLCCNSLARLQKPGPRFTYQFGKTCSRHVLCQYP